MKSNLEHTIKKQLENREIPVSENAWDRLQEMMDAPEKSVKKNNKKLWFPLSIAASVILLIGIFGMMILEADSNSNEIKTVKSTETEEIRQELNEIKSPEITEPEEIIKEEKLMLVSNPQPKLKQSKSEIVVEQNLIQVSVEEEITTKSVQNFEETSTLASQKELSPEEPKKPNYVDPEMLLYSIENNNAVIQSNSDFRVVIKDFNK